MSLAISSVLMGVLLLSDGRVLQLRRARSEVQSTTPGRGTGDRGISVRETLKNPTLRGRTT
ncbi:MAG: hypothetical protein WAU32_15785 [Thermoanaerobaculia bacterium]